MKDFSIRQISFHGFMTLITGFTISGLILLLLLFKLDAIKQEQHITEEAYNTLFELKYFTERLLTSDDLLAEKVIWEEARAAFAKQLIQLEYTRGKQSEAFNNLWSVIQSEIDKIHEQLKNPLFQAKNTMDKPLLRRLGEGINTNERSDFYISLNQLNNSIDYLKQYEQFLLDELYELRKKHRTEIEKKLEEMKLYAVALPLVVLVLTVLFALFLSRRIGKNESELITTKNRLEDSLEEFEHLFNTTMESIFLVENRKCVDTNEKAREVFGFASRNEIVGMDILDLIAPDSQALVKDKMEFENTKPYEANGIKKDGTVFPALLKGHNFQTKEKEIRIAAIIDLSELKAKDRELQNKVIELKNKQRKLEEQKSTLDHQAHHDALTNLPNRILLLDRMQQAIKKAKRNSTQIAVLFIDLDHFKEINDSLGHIIGDEVLNTVARRLRNEVRDEDTIARFGGDEFILLLEDIGHVQSIGDIAQKLIDILQKPIQIEGNELYVGSSVGISIFPEDGKNGVTLLRNADSAMYKAKEEGRNTYQFYTADMTELAFERIVMEKHLRRAVENDEFLPFYQPQKNAKNGKFTGMEALIRWQHPEFGLVSPAKFIPLAEDTGLIVLIGEWMLRQVCSQVAQWHRQGLDPGRVAINLSGKQIQQKNLFHLVEEILQSTGCKPEWIALEVTEGFIMKDPEMSIGILNQLGSRGLGIELAIDDFGTGYSSLAYLKKLPINKLKIDQSFIRDIPENSEDAAIVRAIIALANGLNLDVIAEGVESEIQQNFLLEEGCDNMQGYLHGKPVPSDEITWLSS